MTGFSKAVRELVQARSGGFCEVCGVGAVEQAHHRRPRGAGGSKAADTNNIANCLGACTQCHSMIESRREFALDRGWLVRQGHDPAEVPVVWQGTWVQLTDEGRVFYPPTGRDRCERCGFHIPEQGHRSGCQEMSA